MITFGYNNRFNGPFRALIALAVGVVMVVSRTDAMVLAVKIIAAFLLASGLVSLGVGYFTRKNGSMPLMSFNGAVDIILAVLIFMWPEFVAGLITYLIGFILLGFALFQLIALFSANRILKVGTLAFVMPVLVLLAGALLLARPAFLGSAIGLMAGIALIVYGVSELLSSWKVRKAINEYDIRQTRTQQPVSDEDVSVEIRDVSYEKVDEQ